MRLNGQTTGGGSWRFEVVWGLNEMKKFFKQTREKVSKKFINIVTKIPLNDIKIKIFFNQE